MKIYFFGWQNIKWFIREINKMYSPLGDSFYSKKRIESGIAFVVLQWGMIYWFLHNVEKMPASELCLWAGVEMIICGYYINKIEATKQPSNEIPK